jgi:ABC-2 type transport system permease protein
MSASPETAGTIYDIGYRHYDGPRLGRRGALGAIVGSGLRSVFGLGRSARSKIIPWGAVVLAALPAVIAIAVKVLAGDLIELYDYHSYLWSIGALLPIFVAAQAPELVVNDIRNHVLPLYFSRPIRRVDYVVAKGLALGIGLLSLTLLPVLVLFTGRVLAAEDVLAALGDEAGSLPGILGNGILHAVVLASLGLAVCSLAARRAYAAGAILALFLVGSVISGIFEDAGTQSSVFQNLAPFASPLAILDGAREWLFGGVVGESPVGTSEAPLIAYGIAALIVTLLSWAVLALRYRRITA